MKNYAYSVAIVIAMLCFCVGNASSKLKPPKCLRVINPLDTRVTVVNNGPFDGELSIRGKTKCKGKIIDDAIGIDLDSGMEQPLIDFIPALYTFCLEYANQNNQLVHKKQKLKIKDLTNTIVEFSTDSDEDEEIGVCFPEKSSGGGGQGGGKKGGDKIPPCPGAGNGRTDVTVSNFGVENASVSVSAKLSCVEDFIADNLGAAVFIGDSVKFSSLPPGFYTFCYSWDSGIKEINGTQFLQKKHKNKKVTLAGSAEKSISISPGAAVAGSKKGPCVRDPGITDGDYVGRGVVTKGNCPGGDFTFSVDDDNRVNGTLADDGGNIFAITGLYDPATGKVKKGRYRNNIFRNGRYKAFIDADKGAGTFSNFGPGFRCSGVFTLEKVK